MSPTAATPGLERGLELLAYDPFERLREGTRYQQPALFLCSAAAWDAWRVDEMQEEPRAAAGHSLGEYAALVAAGALAFDDAVRLVDERAAAMATAGEANHGTMVAMLGGEARDVRALATRLGLVVANDNAPGHSSSAGRCWPWRGRPRRSSPRATCRATAAATSVQRSCRITR